MERRYGTSGNDSEKNDRKDTGKEKERDTGGKGYRIP